MDGLNFQIFCPFASISQGTQATLWLLRQYLNVYIILNSYKQSYDVNNCFSTLSGNRIDGPARIELLPKVHGTGITEVMGSNPVENYIFSDFSFAST